MFFLDGYWLLTLFKTKFNICRIWCIFENLRLFYSFENMKENICEICNQTFKTLFKLHEHERVHSGEVSYCFGFGLFY